ncbi:MAG: hypothetical protein DRP71_08940 [Verrucomicrobia bacterium]|nr:MAG: hypothetical protein DRP71_08940 [Verrucomicrobiota bacterium]
MSKKANPTAVGLFVVIGTILLIAGIISFSSFKVKGETQEFVLYFDSSVKGLSVGAPVTHRGVKIGTVIGMQLRFNQADGDFDVPVFIELDHDMLKARSDREVDFDNEALLKDLIDNGLRAKLEASSFVTGQLYIELSIMPDAEPPVYHQIEPIYSEMPTAHADIAAFMKSLGKMDIAGVTEKLSSVLELLEGKIEKMDVADISAGLTKVLAAIEQTLNDPTLDQALVTTEAALNDFKETSEVLRGEVVSVSGDIKSSLKQIDGTMIEIREGVADIRHIISSDSVLAHDLRDALEQLAKASGSISELTDFILLNPNALISGREQKDQK